MSSKEQPILTGSLTTVKFAAYKETHLVEAGLVLLPVAAADGCSIDCLSNFQILDCQELCSPEPPCGELQVPE